MTSLRSTIANDLRGYPASEIVVEAIRGLVVLLCFTAAVGWLVGIFGGG